MRTNGSTVIKAKKSRNHTELLSKYLKLPIEIKNKKNYDLIKINKVKKIKALNYKILGIEFPQVSLHSMCSIHLWLYIQIHLV